MLRDVRYFTSCLDVKKCTLNLPGAYWLNEHRYKSCASARLPDASHAHT
jgi:hypothetical protein